MLFLADTKVVNMNPNPTRPGAFPQYRGCGKVAKSLAAVP
jgi:hypothetical protein